METFHSAASVLQERGVESAAARAADCTGHCCGHCGSPMCAKKQKGRQHTAYVCSANRQKGRDACGYRQVREDRILPFIAENLRKVRVELEADLPTFAKQLLEHEAQSFDPRLVLVTSDEERFKAVEFSQSAKLDEQSAAQLGQLLVLSQATDSEWRMNAVYQAFWKWADAFNNRGA